MLLQLVRLQGPNNWVRISQHMEHRSPKQCRERYHQNLKPSLNHEPISPDEGEVIEQLVQDMGKRWAEIARRLGNRSDNAVKNWWNGSMNRRKRPHNPSTVMSRGVGPRSQPIRATEPPRFKFEGTGGQCFATPQTLDQPPDNDGRIPSASFTHPHSKFNTLSPLNDESHQHWNSLPQPYLPRLDPRGPLPTLEAHSAPSSLHTSPSPFSLRTLHPPPAPHGMRPSTLESRHSYPSQWQLPRVHEVEQPAVSPATTDFSSLPPANQAPSLISDNQSHYSISPKTVSSPRPSLPAPIDTSTTRVWNPDVRRNSCGPHAPYDEGDVSALSASTSVQSSTTRFPLDPCLKRTVSQPDAKSPSEVQIPGLAASSPTGRDSRMNVSRLLE